MVCQRKRALTVAKVSIVMRRGYNPVIPSNLWPFESLIYFNMFDDKETVREHLNHVIDVKNALLQCK